MAASFTFVSVLSEPVPWTSSLCMQDVLLYAVNVFYYNWLIKTLIWTITRQNRARWEIQAEIQGEERQS